MDSYSRIIDQGSGLIAVLSFAYRKQYSFRLALEIEKLKQVWAWVEDMCCVVGPEDAYAWTIGYDEFVSVDTINTFQ